MSPDQCVLILALLADLRLTVERLSTENAELRKILAERAPVAAPTSAFDMPVSD